MRKLSLEHYLMTHFASSSVDTYLRSIEEFTATNPKADSFGYMDVVKYMIEIQKKHSGGTPTYKLAAIKKYYDYLIFTGQRHDHPCKNYTVKVKQNRSIRFDELFTADELEMLLDREERYANMKERNRAMMSLLIYQGLTLKELERLRVQDINIDDCNVFIRPTAKTAKRLLSMQPKQVAIMIDYMNVREELMQCSTDKFLISARGMGMTADSINAIIDSMKLLFLDRNLNPTTIRQSVISNWLNVKRKPLDEVQIMAGHKHPSSTERYIRKDMNSRVELINKFHPLE